MAKLIERNQELLVENAKLKRNLRLASTDNAGQQQVNQLSAINQRLVDEKECLERSVKSFRDGEAQLRKSRNELLDRCGELTEDKKHLELAVEQLREDLKSGKPLPSNMLCEIARCYGDLHEFAEKVLQWKPEGKYVRLENFIKHKINCLNTRVREIEGINERQDELIAEKSRLLKLRDDELIQMRDNVKQWRTQYCKVNKENEVLKRHEHDVATSDVNECPAKLLSDATTLSIIDFAKELGIMGKCPICGGTDLRLGEAELCDDFEASGQTKRSMLCMSCGTKGLEIGVAFGMSMDVKKGTKQIKLAELHVMYAYTEYDF